MQIHITDWKQLSRSQAWLCVEFKMIWLWSDILNETVYKGRKKEAFYDLCTRFLLISQSQIILNSIHITD